MYGYHRTNFAEQESLLKIHEKIHKTIPLKFIVFQQNAEVKKYDGISRVPKIRFIEPHEIEKRDEKHD